MEDYHVYVSLIIVLEDAFPAVARYDLLFQLQQGSGHSQKLKNELQAVVNSDARRWKIIV